MNALEHNEIGEVRCGEEGCHDTRLLPTGRHDVRILASRDIVTGCTFEVPQNLRRLIKVYAITFTPECRCWMRSISSQLSPSRTGALSQSGVAQFIRVCSWSKLLYMNRGKRRGSPPFS